MKTISPPKFLVVGLPRSRTAWMANFLTYDGNFCHHEAINNCNSLEEYWRKVAGVGDSSTGLMLLDLPDVPTLIIERDVCESIRFCRESFGFDGTAAMTEVKRRMDRMSGLRVAFDEIDDRLEEIWTYLVGTAYDAARGDALKNLRVEVKDVTQYDLLPGLEDDLCRLIA